MDRIRNRLLLESHKFDIAVVLKQSQLINAPLVPMAMHLDGHRIGTLGSHHEGEIDTETGQTSIIKDCGGGPSMEPQPVDDLEPQSAANHLPRKVAR